MKSKLINFFSTRSVQTKIRENKLSEIQLFIYFYLIFMFDAISIAQQCLSTIGRQPTILDLATIWGYLIFNAIALIILFVVNGGVEGKNFVSKFFAFSFTVGIKYFITLTIVVCFIHVFNPNFSSTYQAILDLIVNLLMLVNIAIRIHQTN